MVLYALSAPWLLPNFVVEGGQLPGAPLRRRFADYPYASGARGYLLEEPQLTLFGDERLDAEAFETSRAPDTQVRLPVRQLIAGQLAVESGVGIDDGILRTGFRARVQFPLRLELDADWSVFREAVQGGVDQAWLGREHLSVRFAEAESIQFRSGLGPQHFCDAQGCVHGVDFTWGFDAFPGRPVVLSAEAALGNLGQAFAPSVRARLGFMVGPVELGAGWNQSWISGIPLGGPHVSVAAWF